MTTARVTSKGRITIPKDVRDRLGIEPGDELEFAERDHTFVVTKKVAESPFDQFVGFLEHLRGRTPDEIVDEMRGERLSQ